MNLDDEKELAWWRQVFSTRFTAGNLPSPGQPLFGLRLRVVNEDTGLPLERQS